MSDDEYEIPLRDQRYFGSGLKRKRIQFVSSTTRVTPTHTSSRTNEEVTAAEKYLAIVLGKRSKSADDPVREHVRYQQTPDTKDDIPVILDAKEALGDTEEQLCEICSKPLGDETGESLHNNSLVHQICMKHSHPPSHLDRDRKGLSVLQSYGWDPDERRGLGAGGEGILHPIKAKENAARVGLGAQPGQFKIVSKPVKLDAGKVRRSERDAQKQREKLREAFYQSDDVERYLAHAEYGHKLMQ